MIIREIKAQDTLAIRHKVLWPEKPIDFCKLDDDDRGLHYGLYIDQKLISVASVFIKNKSARLRKFATLEDFQGVGYGSTLLNNILDDLKKRECKTFWCDARLTATEFYKRFNMYTSGEAFYKSDVKYIVMIREL